MKKLGLTIRRNSTWRQRKINQRAEEQLDPKTLPGRVAAGGANAHLADVYASKRPDRVAVLLAVVVGLTVVLEERAERRKDRRDARVKAADDMAGKSPMNPGLWTIAWPFVTTLDYTVSTTLVSLLMPTADGLALDSVIVGLTAFTMITGHVVGSAARACYDQALHGRLERMQKVKLIAAALVLALYCAVTFGILAATGAGTINSMQVLFVLATSTVLYFVKPAPEVTDHARLALENLVSWLWLRKVQARAGRAALALWFEAHRVNAYMVAHGHVVESLIQSKTDTPTLPTADDNTEHLEQLRTADLAVDLGAVLDAIKKLGEYGVRIPAVVLHLAALLGRKAAA